MANVPTIKGFKVSAALQGMDKVLKNLAGLSDQVRTKAGKKAAEAAAAALLQAARSKAPRETGLLKQSLGSQVRLYPESGYAVAVVGPQTGYRKSVVRSRNKWASVRMTANPVMYAHLVERGTYRSRAQPFLKPALESSRSRLLKVVSDAYRKALEEKSQ